jgi:hypothetical protein
MVPSLDTHALFGSSRGDLVGVWLLCSVLALGTTVDCARAEPGNDPDIPRECITITRDDTLGSNFGDLRLDGMCPLNEQGFCRSRRINVRVENVCERELPLVIIKGMKGPFAIWADKIPAAKGGRPSVRYYSCEEQYDKCRGIAIALRPLHKPQARSIQLTEDVRRRLRRLLLADEFLAGLIKAAAGFDFFFEAVGPGGRGPTLFAWDKTAIDAWREVSKELEKVNQQFTCHELKSLTETNQSADNMFQSIADGRGCSAIGLID